MIFRHTYGYMYVCVYTYTHVQMDNSPPPLSLFDGYFHIFSVVFFVMIENENKTGTYV